MLLFRDPFTAWSDISGFQAPSDTRKADCQSGLEGFYCTPLRVTHSIVCSCLLTRVDLADIKTVSILTTTPTPTFICLTACPFNSSLIYLFVSCYPPSLLIPTESLLSPTMVTSTRAKNKLAHPAAPIMTEAAKRKAGIKHKQRPKRVTKDETIRELQAQIAALKNPEGETFSKEPLVCKI